MRKIVALSILGAGITFLIIAPKLPAQSAEQLERIQSTVHQLKLTPQQEAKLLPILKEEAPKVEAIKNNSSLSGLQKAQEIRAIHSQTAPQVEKILTPAQYQQLQAIREKRIQQSIAKRRAGMQ